VQNPTLVADVFKLYGPDNIVIALDVFVDNDKAMVATNGWQQTSVLDIHTVIDRYLDLGLQHILCTDIHCDGTLLGPNFSLYQKILAMYPELKTQASGGVSSLDDIIRLREIGVDGVIIGKALYENRFSLSEALAC